MRTASVGAGAAGVEIGYRMPKGTVAMERNSGFRMLRMVGCAAAALLLLWTGAVRADVAGASTDPAATLSARYTALKGQLGRNQFNRPLRMESGESTDGVTGEIFALVDHPFATVGAALDKPSQWCDILILHLNTKYCRPSTGSQGTVLHVNIGKKFDQPVDEAYRLDFDYRVAARSADYLQVKLNADEGPFSTRDYRIVLEATPAEAGQTFIRLAYSYSYGMVGQLAMRAYLNTVGRSKVGFTVIGTESDSRPRFIGGMRGLVERNTMRYYLAVESFLGALSETPKARAEKSLRDWFAATEQYPRQLHEIEKTEYLDMKHREFSRQQAGVL
jgi:hypothetical protein